MVKHGRQVEITDDRIVFHNLVASSTVVGDKQVITARKQTPAAAVTRSNAKGDLRDVNGVAEMASLGAEAAKEFLALRAKNKN